MLSHNSSGTAIEGKPTSLNKDCVHMSSITTLDILLYSDSALEQETTFCFEEDYDTRLFPIKTQKPLVLCLS